MQTTQKLKLKVNLALLWNETGLFLAKIVKKTVDTMTKFILNSEGKSKDSALIELPVNTITTGLIRKSSKKIVKKKNAPLLYFNMYTIKIKKITIFKACDNLKLIPTCWTKKPDIASMRT